MSKSNSTNLSGKNKETREKSEKSEEENFEISAEKVEKIIEMFSDDNLKVVKDIKEVSDEKVTPYREIILSDGKGFYIKTTCSLTSDNRVQIIQYRESADLDGIKFLCSEPTYFETKQEFFEWLSQIIIKNFEDIPYITISPIKDIEIKEHERETTEAMYL